MKQIYILTIFTLSNFLCSSQTFVNGSFENTTANSCTYNISNSTFNNMMNNTLAFGSYQALDIQLANCYIPSVPNGNYAVGIANNPSNNSQGEAIALELTIPLVSGNQYSLSFDAYSITNFGPQGNLLLGSSDTGNNFGIEIYNANTISSQWTSFTFTFIAPNNGTHITVMPVSGISSWNSIDNFVIESTLSVENINDNKLFKAFPNPSSDFIQIQGVTSQNNYRIYNVLGLEIKKGLISNNEKINISNFANGIYFLKFDSGYSIKILKE